MNVTLLLLFTLLLCGRTSAFIDQAILYPSNGTGEPFFGWSVAISSDGSRALVGAFGDDTVGTDAGAAYIFDVNPNNSSDWMPQTILYPRNASVTDQFGYSVALSSDGTRALVGAPFDNTEDADAGAAYLFDVNPSNASDWMLQTILYPSNPSGLPSFGWSLALSSNGSRALIGAPGDDTEDGNAGAAYVVDVNPSNSSDWILQTILYPSIGTGNPFFGVSVAISSDGERALVGAYTDDTQGLNAGAAYLFDVNPSNSSDWTLQTVLYPSVGSGSPYFGRSVAISSDGSRALVGAYTDDTVDTNAGAAYMFDVNPSNSSDWMLQSTLYPSNGTGQPAFGRSVALSSDGSRAIVGAGQADTEGTDAGATYVFDANPSNASDWMLHTILYPSIGTGNPFFGYAVATSSDGTRALVGAMEDDTEGTDAGAAYVLDACPGGSIINKDGTACVTTIEDQTITITDNDILIVDGDLNIQSNASITLTLNGPMRGPFIVVSGCASFGGILTINGSSILDGDEDETIDLIVAEYAGGLCPNYTAFDRINVIEGSDCGAVANETYGETSLDVLITTTDSGGCSGRSSKDGYYVPIILGSAGALLLLCCAMGIMIVVVCVCGTSLCMGVVVVPLLYSMGILQQQEEMPFKASGDVVNFDYEDGLYRTTTTTSSSEESS